MSIDSKFQEHEYKYNADEVGLEDFEKLVDSIGNPLKSLDISSWDVYYTIPEDKLKFQRFRNSDTPELTKKVKLNDNNNWARIEVDLPLDKSRIDEYTVARFVGIDGYHENFRIYKTCFVRWFSDVNMVYYIVYDKSMRETGRFIEVEVNKEYETQDPTEVLNRYEQFFSRIGITHRHRLKKSLFEIYSK